MTHEQIVQAIEEITAALKRPLPFYERRLLHEERKDLRKRLTELDSATGEAQ